MRPGKDCLPLSGAMHPCAAEVCWGGGKLSWPQPAGTGSETFQIVLQHLALSTAEPVSSAVVPLRKRV